MTRQLALLACLFTTCLGTACGEREPVDDDGDGYYSNVDCDDGDAAVHPDADELCDGIDNDCDRDVDDEDDGVVDQGWWYPDGDGDGYGMDDGLVVSCTQPDGTVEQGGDCDDERDDVSPGATEVCDTADLDEDCDGLVNDDDDSLDLSTADSWYPDDDRDSYGDADHGGRQACRDPSSWTQYWSPSDTDCDDDDKEVNPAASELCDGIDNDCDEAIDEDSAVDAPSWYTDADGDGYGDAHDVTVTCYQPSGTVADDTDCDDTEASTNPGADEYCDGHDDDCDGEVDEDTALDTTTWYADSDGDGFGDAESALLACYQPTGFLLDDTDCDDSDPDSNPDAVEYCDGHDDDCDGDVDEPEAADAATWYADADGDGFGDVAATEIACAQPSGHLADATDCDDADATTHPGSAASDSKTACMSDSDGDGWGDDDPASGVTAGTDCDDDDSMVHPAATETCNDIDDDCDGLTDDDDDPVSDTTPWYADSDSDGYGDAATNTERCDAPSGYVAGATDCDDDDAAINPATTEVCDDDDIDEDCDGLADNDDAAPTGTSTFYTDADGDGFGDASTTIDTCDLASGIVDDATDCDDSDATVYPGATETWYDGVISDCDSDSDYDADGDGWDSDGYGGLDRDDADASIWPGSTTVYVPDDYASIQDAIDAIGIWDSVIVAAGSYAENISLGSTSINLIGEGSDLVEVTGDGTGPVMSIDGPEETVVEGFTLTGGDASCGGGLYVTDVGELSLTDLVLTGNTADSGGGLCIDESSWVDLDLASISLEDNVASDAGGGAWLSLQGSGTLDVDGMSISGNAADDGGGLYLDAASMALDLTELSISTNDASGDAGGVGILVDSCTLDIITAALEDNTAGDHAGLYLSNTSSTVTIDDLEVDGNDAGTSHGGATFDSSGGSLTLSELSVTNNVGHGALTLDTSSTTVSLSDAVVSSNTYSGSSGSTAAGLVVWESGGRATLSSIEVSDNVATGYYGGALLDWDGSMTISEMSVTGNHGDKYGGIRMNSDGSCDVDDVTIEGNSSNSGTAGGYFQLRGWSTNMVSNLLIQDNTGPYAATFTTANGSDSTVSNVRVVANSARGVSIGSSHHSGNTLIVRNFTVAGNGNDGMKFHGYNSGNTNTLVNLISAYNGGYGFVVQSGATPELSYSNLYGNDSGAYTGISNPIGTDGNVAVTPDFIAFSEDGDPDLWDLHQPQGGAMIDAGDPSILDADGTTSDIGAHGGPDSDGTWYLDDDADGMWDGWEETHDLDTSIDDSADDLDGDGLTNAEEFAAGTWPEEEDTDGDGVSDDDELTAGSDPLD